MAYEEISPQKSWYHAIEKVNKVGYADGAVDGQNSAFQSSFDLGYQQGIEYGMKHGLEQGLKIAAPCSNSQSMELSNYRTINCLICENGISKEQNIVNLYNSQQEKNAE